MERHQKRVLYRSIPGKIELLEVKADEPLALRAEVDLVADEERLRVAVHREVELLAAERFACMRLHLKKLLVGGEVELSVLEHGEPEPFDPRQTGLVPLVRDGAIVARMLPKLLARLLVVAIKPHPEGTAHDHPFANHRGGGRREELHAWILRAPADLAGVGVDGEKRFPSRAHVYAV